MERNFYNNLRILRIIHVFKNRLNQNQKNYKMPFFKN